MARWVRGPFNSIEELHDNLVESLLEDDEQLFKLEIAADKELTNVQTYVGHIDHMQLNKSGDQWSMSIYWSPEDEDPIYIHGGMFLAGIKFWVEE